MAENSGAEKTEEATEHKKTKEREKGNVSNSKDLSAFIVLVISLFTLFFLFEPMLKSLVELYRYYSTFYSIKEILPLDIYQITMISMKYFLFIFMPIAGTILIAGLIGSISQVGFLFSIEPIRPKLSKINPIAGLKRIFSLQTFVNGFKMVFQVSIVFTVAFILLWQFLKELPEVTLFSYFYQLIWLRDKAIIIIGSILSVFMVFALFDFFFTKSQHNKKMRMTKQEVKDEMKNIDGNPEIKQRIKKVQMEMAQQRMMNNVQDSDVVITNPTHYAVAILYDPDKYGLPIVSAKGTDLLAVQIKDIARENNIPIIENKPLARQLYAQVKLNDTIPENLFKAVAEILSYIATLKNKK
jgi:flagellar biosynthetic protein FlhB